MIRDRALAGSALRDRAFRSMALGVEASKTFAWNCDKPIQSSPSLWWCAREQLWRENTDEPLNADLPVAATVLESGADVQRASQVTNYQARGYGKPTVLFSTPGRAPVAGRSSPSAEPGTAPSTRHRQALNIRRRFSVPEPGDGEQVILHWGAGPFRQYRRPAVPGGLLIRVRPTEQVAVSPGPG